MPPLSASIVHSDIRKYMHLERSPPTTGVPSYGQIQILLAGMEYAFNINKNILKIHYNFKINNFIQFSILNDTIFRVNFFSWTILSKIKRMAHAWFLQTMQDNDWDTDEPHPLFQCILPLRCLLIKDSRPEHWAAIQVTTQEYLHDLNYYFSLHICLYRSVMSHFTISCTTWHLVKAMSLWFWQMQSRATYNPFWKHTPFQCTNTLYKCTNIVVCVFFF